eukprot:353880-Chlamydomonas_euryale.AAC.13
MIVPERTAFAMLTPWDPSSPSRLLWSRASSCASCVCLPYRLAQTVFLHFLHSTLKTSRPSRAVRVVGTRLTA